MKKLTIYIVVATLCLNFSSNAQVKTLNLKGKIIDENGVPVAGINLSVKDTKIHTVTNKDGVFDLLNVQSGSTLKISGTGYKTKQLADIENWDLQIIVIQTDNTNLKEVEIISTGYQNIPKERVTGSFVFIDSALLNRRIGTNILERLEGVTSGLIFNKNNQNPNSSAISIRGKSTILGNDQPLIILDNFPYMGDINNINPNDIESISVLKDASAASIWGVRAGNGVIVIKTKKGKYNNPLSVSFNSNITIIDKPDLHYTPQLSSKNYILVEKFLFENGYYNTLNNGYSAISPVIEILKARKEKQISKEDSIHRIAQFMTNDGRYGIEKYLYRKAINQQYAFNVSGGSENNSFSISTGYDRNLQQLVTDSYNRLTINANNTVSFLAKRLEWTTNLLFTNSETNSNTYRYVPSTPYEQLADGNGNPLPIVKDLRQAYIDTAGSGRLLDWKYIPLNENHPNQRSNLTDYRFSTGLSYKLLGCLKVSALFLHQKGITNLLLTQGANSYYTRNLINTYSQINSTTGEVYSPIAQGDIVSKDFSNYKTSSGRLQLNYDQQFGTDHKINIIAGFELSDYQSSNDSFTLYGYDQATGINSNDAIDPTFDYPQYFGYNTGRITTGLTSANTIDRNRSYYANGSYSYKSKYILSLSARRDESNLFGVRTNQKGVPLWSAGLSWSINSEPLYKLNWLPFLKLRASYGYNGNVDKTTTAYLTATSSPGSLNTFNSPYLFITNPPNPSLRWEKVRVINLGLDFEFKNSYVSGSIEYYEKKSSDLIGNSPIAQQSGVSQFKGNSADMITRGVDLTLNLKTPISHFVGNTTFLFNYVKNKVTNYKLNAGSNYDVISGNYNNPLIGFPLYSIFYFPSSKLDEKGNPQGYINNSISEDYSAILNTIDRNYIKFKGSATPVIFGSVITNWTYRDFDLSIGVSYKLGYYFRKPSINYTALFAGAYQQSDFDKRWQKPGDENTTEVPSMVYSRDSNRDIFYNYSDKLIQRADNIRLQDLKLGYTITRIKPHQFPFSSLKFYIYANNLGIIWKANHSNLDPDSPFLPHSARSISLGIKANL